MSKGFLAKISFILLLFSLNACNIYRKIPSGKYLLRENKVYADSVKVKKEEVTSLIIQQPNVRILGYPILADIYMFADQHPETTFRDWVKKHSKAYKTLQQIFSKKQLLQLEFYYRDLNKFIKEIGEPAVFVDSTQTQSSKERLLFYYENQGYLDAKGNFQIQPKTKKKADVTYNIKKGKPYTIEKYEQEISSRYLKKLFDEYKKETSVKTGKVYLRKDFEDEKQRLISLFRNKGVYHFQPSYVNFYLLKDTLHNKKTIDAILNIPQRTIINKDSVLYKEFVPYHIKDVKLFITKNKNIDLENIKDSTQYQGIKIYSLGEKLKYRPKVLTKAVLINKGDLYSDKDRLRTHRLLMNLRNFKQVYIQYDENEKDSSLVANIYLLPEKRFGLKNSLDVTHSNIHNLGIKGSVEFTAKNLFKGAEVLNLSTYLMTASSKTITNPDETFFNVSELGTNLTLNIPRLLMPFGLNKYIPKYMLPRTYLTFFANTQKNIGLDQSKYVGIMGYEWRPIKERKFKLDLLNLEFITNKRPDKYFSIYSIAYDQLKDIANQVNADINENNAGDFLNDFYANYSSICQTNPEICREINAIKERKTRITQNLFIISNRFDFYYDSRKQLLQQDFYLFNTTVELAGSLLRPFAAVLNFPKNDLGQYSINGVPFAEYTKLDINFIKHWRLHKQHILAYRTFLGIAIPHGNTKNVPFASGYFGGGSNDIRAWRAYTLGPGTSGGPNEFNEGNLKFTTNLEYRFPIAGYFKGAVFADAGNIWNYHNNQTDDTTTFKGFASLKDIALGTGFGLRVDFTYFILRFDLAFKTYDPSLPENQRWLLKDVSLDKAVLNLGISYPF